MFAYERAGGYIFFDKVEKDINMLKMDLTLTWVRDALA
jgi:hypothetical protein